MSTPALEISDGSGRALISPHGAELVAWRVGEQELMWTPEPAIWDRVSPLLFPVVGWCRDGKISVDGESYPMGVHGFAAQCLFSLVSHLPDRLEFVLRDSDKTRAHYPFSFELSVSYQIRGASLAIELCVRNSGAAALPYACGVHPGFRWPLKDGARADHEIRFSHDEIAKVPVIAPGGLFSTQRRPVDLHDRKLTLSDATFAQEALCFLDARSTALEFVSGDGASVHAAFENLPHLAIWSKPGAPFVCLEAWTGYGDPVDFSGDIKGKPSMALLAPGHEALHRATFTFRSAG